jgi:hypothetical protein
MKYLIKFIIKTEHVYLITAIQNVLKNKFIKEIDVIEFFYCENKNYYYLTDSKICDYDVFYKYIEEIVKKYEKYIKNIYPEFLDDWYISFRIY